MDDGKTWEQGASDDEDHDAQSLRLSDGDHVHICAGDWDIEVSVFIDDGGAASISGDESGTSGFVNGGRHRVFHTSGPGDEVHICPGEWTVEVSAFLDDGGAATISGAEDGSSGFVNGGVHRAFDTGGPGHLTFKNLFFRDGLILDLGRAAGFGAAMDQVTLESVVIEGNTAFSGGGLSLGPSSEVTIRNSRIVNNRAEMAGGGAALAFGFSRLVSENTDWGSGEDDNTPDDIAITDDFDEVLGSWSFGDNASFVCSWEDRTCE